MSHYLSVVWYKVLPAHAGGQKGIALFNQHLGRQVNLTCLASKNNMPEEDLTYTLLPLLPVSKTQFINPLVKKNIINLLKQNKFTHLILEHPYHAWLARYKNKFQFKLIVHAHNIEALRMQQRQKWWWRWVRHLEKKAFQKADYILFKTEEDLLLAHKIYSLRNEKCLLLPYGISYNCVPEKRPWIKTKIRTQYGLFPGEKMFLFAGSPDYEPNEAAFRTIIEKIIPELQKKAPFPFRVFITGRQKPAIVRELLPQKNIVLTGFVDSIDDYMQAADVFINPVITGSGIQTKNIEAIANGLSVAATAFSAKGLPDYLSPAKLLVAANEDWQQFTNHIIQLSQSSFPTPGQFYNDFYWDNIISRFIQNISA
jgi:glycosyltransferase involved in cell wall biosynthesis